MHCTCTIQCSEPDSHLTEDHPDLSRHPANTVVQWAITDGLLVLTPLLYPTPHTTHPESVMGEAAHVAGMLPPYIKPLSAVTALDLCFLGHQTRALLYCKNVFTGSSSGYRSFHALASFPFLRSLHLEG